MRENPSSTSRKERSSKRSSPGRAKKQSSPSWGPTTSLTRDAWQASRAAWQAPHRCPTARSWRLKKEDVIPVLHAQPTFAELFLHYLLSRNIRIEEDLVDQLFNSSEKRLARVLLLLANFGKEGKPEPVIPKMSQETLAEIVGTTR